MKTFPNRDQTRNRKHSPSSAANSSVGSIRDIDIEQTDFISGESLISTEQELIELLKKAYLDETDRTHTTNSSDEIERFRSSTGEEDIDFVDGADVEDNLLSSIENYDDKEQHAIDGNENLSESQPGMVANAFTIDEQEALQAIANFEEDDIIDNKTASMEEFELLEKMFKEEKEQQRLSSVKEENERLDQEKRLDGRKVDFKSDNLVPIFEGKASGNLDIRDDVSVAMTSDNSLSSNHGQVHALNIEEYDSERNSNVNSNNVAQDELLDLIGTEDSTGNNIDINESDLGNAAFEQANYGKDMNPGHSIGSGMKQSIPALPEVIPSTSHLAAFVSRNKKTYHYTPCI